MISLVELLDVSHKEDTPSRSRDDLALLDQFNIPVLPLLKRDEREVIENGIVGEAALVNLTFFCRSI